MTRTRAAALAAAAVTAALAAAVTVDVRARSALADARNREAAADQRAARAEARPPKTVTRTVTVTKPVFGRSTLLGAYAAGAISGGVYTDGGVLSYTASDATCSQQYAAISTQQVGGTVSRDAFMKACLTNIDDTAKSDPAP
ncbi:hypothetical protein [Streptacidiphilus monticola]|uniref:Uncharacterized protein n=1 Tax=Streptacidiphilus monticola TaxID=2161674 RepID=A0ABW1G992_9ACTN